LVDGEGKPVNGANKYVIHFDKGTLPPVEAFWSVTMYDADSFFVANPINRYAISSWMPLKKNADGSLDIYVQRESPGKTKESNWLPANDKDFHVTLRMYWPNEKAPSIIERDVEAPRRNPGRVDSWSSPCIPDRARAIAETQTARLCRRR
jgi:hypothetical protein